MDECRDPADQAVFNLETARLNLLLYSRWVGCFSLLHVCGTLSLPCESNLVLACVIHTSVPCMCCCSRPPTPYSLVFMDNTTKQKWEADFLEAKKAAEVVLKSRRAASMRFSSAQLTLHNLDFLHSLDLQPGRVGMKVRLFVHMPVNSFSFGMIDARCSPNTHCHWRGVP